MTSARASSAPGRQVDDGADEERLAACAAVDPDTFTDVYDGHCRVVHGYVAGQPGVELAEELRIRTAAVGERRTTAADRISEV